MHALVTGAAGFFGSHLVRELIRQGWTVTPVVRRPISGPCLVVDLATDRLDPEPFRQADVVFHAAGVLSDWGRWPHFLANTVRACDGMPYRKADNSDSTSLEPAR